MDQIETIKGFFFFTDDMIDNDVRDRIASTVNPMLNTCFTHQFGSTIQTNLFATPKPNRFIVINSIDEPTKVIATLSPSASDPNTYMVSNVCSSVSRQGLGNLLMDSIREWAIQHKHKLYLTVYVYNPMLSLVISLYSKYGFVYRNYRNTLLYFTCDPSQPIQRNPLSQVYIQIMKDQLRLDQLKKSVPDTIVMEDEIRKLIMDTFKLAKHREASQTTKESITDTASNASDAGTRRRKIRSLHKRRSNKKNEKGCIKK